MRWRFLLGALIATAALVALAVACDGETPPEPDVADPQAGFNAALTPPLRTVRFAPDRSALTARERAELTELASAFADNRGALIAISGDAGPSDRRHRTTGARRRLALDRANTVADYLVELGVPPVALTRAREDRGPLPAAYVDPGAMPGAGSLLYRRWHEIGDTAVDDFDFGAPADYAARVPAARTPISVCEECAFELSGSIIAPRSGSYRFWISADDEAVLELSPGHSMGDAREIARVALNEWTAPDEFDTYNGQRSAAVDLVAGERYAIRARGRELFSADHIALRWSPPGAARGAIPQAALRPPP